MIRQVRIAIACLALAGSVCAAQEIALESSTSAVGPNGNSSNTVTRTFNVVVPHPDNPDFAGLSGGYFYPDIVLQGETNEGDALQYAIGAYASVTYNYYTRQVGDPYGSATFIDYPQWQNGPMDLFGGIYFPVTFGVPTPFTLTLSTTAASVVYCVVYGYTCGDDSFPQRNDDAGGSATLFSDGLVTQQQGYITGAGVDAFYTPVPEPSAFAPAIGAIWFIIRSHRRRKA